MSKAKSKEKEKEKDSSSGGLSASASASTLEPQRTHVHTWTVAKAEVQTVMRGTERVFGHPFDAFGLRWKLCYASRDGELHIFLHPLSGDVTIRFKITAGTFDPWGGLLLKDEFEGEDGELPNGRGRKFASRQQVLDDPNCGLFTGDFMVVTVTIAPYVQVTGPAVTPVDRSGFWRELLQKDDFNDILLRPAPSLSTSTSKSASALSSPSETIPCNRAVLRHASPVFRNMLSHGFRESLDGEVALPYAFNVVKCAVEFLYAGTVLGIHALPFADAWQLFKFGFEYELPAPLAEHALPAILSGVSTANLGEVSRWCTLQRAQLEHNSTAQLKHADGHTSSSSSGAAAWTSAPSAERVALLAKLQKGLIAYIASDAGRVLDLLADVLPAAPPSPAYSYPPSAASIASISAAKASASTSASAASNGHANGNGNGKDDAIPTSAGGVAVGTAAAADVKAPPAQVAVAVSGTASAATTAAASSDETAAVLPASAPAPPLRASRKRQPHAKANGATASTSASASGSASSAPKRRRKA